MPDLRSASELRSALAERVVVLDGGLSTELERRGHDLSGTLWSARLLRDAPEAVVDVHAAFLRAGAEVITTASYQATAEGFARAGFDPADSATLISRSVQLARQARDQVGSESSGPQQVWIAGSIGPFGAMLADGSEYTGDYGDDVDLRRLREFHRPRLELLCAAGVDVLALETVPSVLEAEALVAELAAVQQPGWLSLTTALGPDGVVRTRRGEPAEEAFALAGQSAEIIAIGVNCTEPFGLAAAIELAAKASGKPVVAYPNSGETWDAVARRWLSTEPIGPDRTNPDRTNPDPTGPGPTTTDPTEKRATGQASIGFGQATIEGWVAAGARLVGGCCRVGPDMIADLTQNYLIRNLSLHS